MTQRSRYFCMLIAFCLAVFSSCEVNESAPLVQESPRPALGGEACNLNSNHWFPLQYHATENDSLGEYVFELKTGAFYSDNCLCEADRFEIDFTSIPTNAVVVARNIDGDTINSILYAPDPATSEVFTLVIQAFEEASDDFVTIYVDFDSTASPLPNVAEAGGLCIVENYGGLIYPPILYTSPIRISTDNYPPGSGSTDKIWLPIAIGTPLN